MKHDITFIIPVYNAEKTIESCIESVLAQNCPKIVIVIDNNSKDSTEERIKKYPSVKYLFEEKPGASSARNAGLRHVKTEFVAFVDADVILPDKEWINNCLATIKGDVIGCGGPGRAYSDSEISKALSLHYGNVEKKSHVNVLATMDMVVKSEAIEGDFFNPLLLRAQDPEFCFRLVEKGHQLLYSEELWVYHNHPTSIKGLLTKWYRYGEYYFLPYLLHRSQIKPSVLLRVVFMPVFIVSLLISLTNMQLVIFPVAIILGLYLSYIWAAFKIGYQGNKIIFGTIHVLKQLSHTLGILRGLFKRMTLKAIFLREL